MLKGVNRHVWENTWSEFCLDLHLMSCGAAQAMVHAWLLNVRSIVFEGRAMPEFVRYSMLQLTFLVFVTFAVVVCLHKCKGCKLFLHLHLWAEAMLCMYSILTGWGKHSKIAGASTLRHVIEALLNSIGAPFQVERFNIGRFVSPSVVVAAWLRESGTINMILLSDERAQRASPSNLVPRLEALQL